MSHSLSLYVIKSCSYSFFPNLSNSISPHSTAQFFWQLLLLLGSSSSRSVQFSLPFSFQLPARSITTSLTDCTPSHPSTYLTQPHSIILRSNPSLIYPSSTPYLALSFSCPQTTDVGSSGPSTWVESGLAFVKKCQHSSAHFGCLMHEALSSFCRCCRS